MTSHSVLTLILLLLVAACHAFQSSGFKNRRSYRSSTQARRGVASSSPSSPTPLSAQQDGFVNESIQDFLSFPLSMPILGTMLVEDVAKVAVPLAFLAYFAATRAPLSLVNKSILDSIVKGTYLERQVNDLECVYKATRDGWTAIDFHEAVDNKGSGIVVARSLTGKTFGGFNANGWRSTDDYYSSTTSFLWYLVPGKKVVKLPILPGGDAAVFDYATSGPCFGAADLLIGPPQAAVMGGFAGPDAEDISKSAGSLRQCKSSVGATYDGDARWPARGNVQLVEVEVYCIQK